MHPAEHTLFFCRWLHLDLELPNEKVLSEVLFKHGLDEDMAVPDRVKTCFILCSIHIEVVKVLE